MPLLCVCVCVCGHERFGSSLIFQIFVLNLGVQTVKGSGYVYHMSSVT